MDPEGAYVTCLFEEWKGVDKLMRAVAVKALQLGKNTEKLTGLLDVVGEGK
jgi:hypothetical protein